MSSAQAESILSIMHKTKTAVKKQTAGTGVNGKPVTKRYVAKKRRKGKR